jgi:hypothetical protein
MANRTTPPDHPGAAAPARRAKPAAKPPVKRAPRRPASPPAAAAKAPTAPAAPAKPAPAAAQGAKSGKSDKPAKSRPRVVRDSFTMPEADFRLIGTLKTRAINAKRPAKKSELLRAGLHVLEGLGAAALVAALDRLMPLKPGRPKK